jgi:hypothetical protein
MALAVIGVLALTACRPHGGGDDRPPRAARSVEIAKEVCEVNALAEEHRSVMTRVDTLEGGIPERERDERWTILMQKLRDYRAEIDGAYRFVTANCKTYNMCMLTHHYEEGRCEGSRDAWMESHQRYNDLAIRLAELERRHHHWKKGPRPTSCGFGCPPAPPPPGPCDDYDCDPMGSMFSSNCCRDRHSRN